MFVHEVHLASGGVIKLNAPADLPVIVEATDNLLKFQFANGNTYAFVLTNVIFYSSTRKAEN